MPDFRFTSLNNLTSHLEIEVKNDDSSLSPDSGAKSMPFTNSEPSDLDELDNYIAGLSHYPLAALAVALRAHLETLLQTLLKGKICSREEVLDFFKELERNTLQYES